MVSLFFRSVQIAFSRDGSQRHYVIKDGSSYAVFTATEYRKAVMRGKKYNISKVKR